MRAGQTLGYILSIIVANGHQALAETAGDAALGLEKAVVCVTCHGADGIAIGPNVPNLRGQQREYLVNSLKAYKNRGRRDPIAVMMYPFADKLSEQDMQDLAAFYSSLACDCPEDEP
jgi:cytochrome c553